MIASNKNPGGALSGAPLIQTIGPVPENVALYQTRHLVDPQLHKQNHGVLTRHRWFPLLRGCRKILEVGCGNGALCEWLSAEYGKRMTGIDLVHGPYERQGYDFHVMDIMETELPRGFDACVSFDVLEHIETEKVGRVLANIDASAPVLVFTIAGYGQPPQHLTVKSPGWWLNMLYSHMANRQWLIETLQRYKNKPSPVYLFMGTPL